MLFSLKDGSLKDASLLPARHRFEPPGERPGPSSRPIHRSAWKKNSRKFTVANGFFTQRQPHDNRPCCTPLTSKRSDLALFVAPICIKGLRLVTVQLPEKSSPIGPGLNRTSP